MYHNRLDAPRLYAVDEIFDKLKLMLVGNMIEACNFRHSTSADINTCKKNTCTKFKIFSLALSCIVIFYSEILYAKQTELPVAQDGIIDLRGWDFLKKGSVELNGIWKFKAGVEDPSFSAREYNDAAWGRINVPGYWNSVTGVGYGFAWYRLRVLVDEAFWAGKPMLYIKGANTSYELFVNGKKTVWGGVVGTRTETSIPSLLPKSIQINELERANEILIAIKVANFFHRGGGLNKPIILGAEQKIQRMIWNMDFFSSLILGFIFMMALYHSILWLKRKEDLASLWFSIFCLVIFIHTLAIDNYFERFFPEINLFEFRFKVEYGTLALTWATFSIFLYYLYPKETGRVYVFSLFFIGILFTAVPLFTYARFFTNYIIVYNVLLLGCGVWTVGAMIVAMIRKRDDAVLCLLGFLVLMLTVVNDILHNHHIIQTFFMSQFGLGGFLFFQSVILSVRFSRAYRTAEYLSKSLHEEVKIKTKELELQTRTAVIAKEEIENSMKKIAALNEHIQKELFLARQVHDRIVPKQFLPRNYLKITIECRPYMSVGGDYYDFADLGEKKTRIFLADMMGHGVSASLMTMLIKSEYDKIKFRQNNPSALLKEMNDFFAGNFKNFKTFFTGVIIDIDAENKLLTFSSAGHHEQYLITNNNLISLERTGRAVGISRDSSYKAIVMNYASGDKLILFTDGVFEEFNLDREEFGINRLKSSIEEQKSCEGNIIVERLISRLESYITEEQLNDDMTIIAVDLL